MYCETIILRHGNADGVICESRAQKVRAGTEHPSPDTAFLPRTPRGAI